MDASQSPLMTIMYGYYCLSQSFKFTFLNFCGPFCLKWINEPLLDRFGLDSGVMACTVGLQKESPQLESRLWPFCLEFACSLRTDVDFQELRLPFTAQNQQVGLIGGSETAVSCPYRCISVTLGTELFGTCR